MNLPTSSAKRPIPMPLSTALTGYVVRPAKSSGRTEAMKRSSPPHRAWAKCSSPVAICG
jgi:hypothetical protein